MRMEHLKAALVLAAIALVCVGASHLAGIPHEVGVFTAMAVVQSAYAENIAEAVAGAWANETNWDADTRICETSAGIGFGLACGQGSADKGAVLGGTLANFVGVSLRDTTLIAGAGQTVDEYAQYANMALANEGDIWVQTSVATSPTDPVHYDATTGIFQITGGSGPIVGARWMKSRDAGLGCLRLSGHMPVP